MLSTMSTQRRMTALEERACCSLRGSLSPLCLPNSGQSTTPPRLPPPLFRIPQSTGEPLSLAFNGKLTAGPK